MVEVYAIRLIEDVDFAELKDRLLSHLPVSSHKIINKYKRLSDLQRSLLGEAIMRQILSRKTSIPSNEISIEKTVKGKPFLANSKNHYFNISHSGEWVVVAFSNEEVGIDVELIRPINYQIAKRFFSGTEYTELDKKEGQEKREFFFNLWTLKESYLKLLGKGLTKSLSSFSIRKSNSGFRLIDEKSEISSVFFKQYLLDKEYKLSACSTSENFVEKLNILSISDIIVR